MEAENYTKSLRRAILLLRCFNLQELELSGAEISRKVGMHKTTAYRMLATLSEDGLLEKNPKTGKYRIGPVLYMMGNLYLNMTDIIGAAEPVVKTLNDLMSEAISVAIFDSGNVTLIMKEESRYGYGTGCI